MVPGQGVYYQWHVSRAADCLTQLLGEDFTGHGYAAYPVYARGRTDVHLAGCTSVHV
ncbi:MAG: hypothetical protein ACJASX_003401, partial [Limisphaerales bacterium]